MAAKVDPRPEVQASKAMFRTQSRTLHRLWVAFPEHTFKITIPDPLMLASSDNPYYIVQLDDEEKWTPVDAEKLLAEAKSASRRQSSPYAT